VQLLGVYDAGLCRRVAESLRALGCEIALVVNGGIDEIALHRETAAALLRDGTIEEFPIEPEQAGLARHSLDALKGGDVAFNAAALTHLLSGNKQDAYAKAVALNAGALLWASGLADDLRAGFERARDAIASGRALERMHAAIALSNAHEE
jgi:anthranilate phosphoribosyltransferase